MFKYITDPIKRRLRKKEVELKLRKNEQEQIATTKAYQMDMVELRAEHEAYEQQLEALK